VDNKLSSLRLPTIFYESSSSSPETYPDISSEISNKKVQMNEDDYDHVSENSKNNNMMTVSRYISKISQNTIIDYMFSCELRYSKNVLQIMKYLASKLCQPFLIYELDFEVTSFFRYIRWKMFNSYLKHTTRLRMLVDRMFGIINLGVSSIYRLKVLHRFCFFKITQHPGIHATPEQMWADIQIGISKHVADLLEFAKDVRTYLICNEVNLTLTCTKKTFLKYLFM
jgi:hypothetical protein